MKPLKPVYLKTRIFLDSGEPRATREAIKFLGFLDGQTTNPSLIAKNPETAGKKFGKGEILEFYKKVVKEVSGLIPDGSVSIEVYADSNTKAEEMLEQGREFFTWIPNAHIKFPTTHEGLKAAEIAVKEAMRVNMTLVFSQEQAAAVYAATAGASAGQVFLSPFIGRLDDRGENGMDLISNIIKMYKNGDGHVEVLSASIRSLSHINEAIRLKSDILTVPFEILMEWSFNMLQVAPEDYYVRPDLKHIDYKPIDLNRSWQEYDISHELTDKGITKFSQDWNALISNK